MEEVIFKQPILPAKWLLYATNEDGYSFVNKQENMGAILSWAKEQDGKMWLHFSLSCRKRIPFWDELVEAKEIFLGVESKAIQVIPPRSKYVNKNPYVLHLFMCLDGDNLPDFTQGSGNL